MTVVRKSRRKTISIILKPDESVVVCAPKSMSDGEINEFIAAKQTWIDKNLQKIRIGRKNAEEEGLLSEEDIEKLRAEAKEYIPKRVEFYAKLIGVTYNKITIRCQKRCWGSASAKHNLNFNLLLMLTPPEVIDSVVVHELCHFKHMNHSKLFYKEVLSAYPSYKKCAKWLKDNELTIFARVKD